MHISAGEGRVSGKFHGPAEMANDLGPDDSGRKHPTHRNWVDGFAPWLTWASVAAIVVLTLYPFQFSAQATALRRIGPFLTWFAPIEKDSFGWLSNVLLFIPLGACLDWWERQKGWKFPARRISVLGAGFLLSFTVEFFQLYLPMRDSSWDDVFMNTLGAVVGLWLFEHWGMAGLNFIEEALGDLTSALRE